jgi:N utilization substance protein A
LHGLLYDGITAALAKKHGPTVQAEVDIDEDKGTIRIVRLRTVVAKSPIPHGSLARGSAFRRPEFQVGDVLEDPVDFAEFGRMAVLAAKQAHHPASP